MINQIKTYALIGLSFLAAVFVVIFWRRGENLAKLQADLFQQKAKEEVIKSEQKAIQARRDYESQRDLYKSLASKFRKRAKLRTSSGPVRRGPKSGGSSTKRPG